MSVCLFLYRNQLLRRLLCVIDRVLAVPRTAVGKRDAGCVAADRVGDRKFAELVARHARIINKVSYFYATRRLPYEDLRQEILVNLWQGIGRFRGDSSLSTWIYRVSVNSALMALRSARRDVETVPLEAALPFLTSEVDDAMRENLQAMYVLINRLGELEKAVILMWLDEYSYEEIAATLGLKRNSVATKIRRIKEKLSKSS